MTRQRDIAKDDDCIKPTDVPESLIEEFAVSLKMDAVDALDFIMCLIREGVRDDTPYP